MNDKYLTTQEAAEYLSLSPRTMEGFRLKGGGPKFYRRGRLVRYKQADLDAWLAESESASEWDEYA